MTQGSGKKIAAFALPFFERLKKNPPAERLPCTQSKKVAFTLLPASGYIKFFCFFSISKRIVLVWWIQVINATIPLLLIAFAKTSTIKWHIVKLNCFLPVWQTLGLSTDRRKTLLVGRTGRPACQTGRCARYGLKGSFVLIDFNEL